MMMQDVETIADSDTIDAVKEIANMVAGTLKSALPRPCVMSVPSADLEPNDFYSRPQTEDSLTVFFHHATGQLMIRVCEIAVEPELALSGI
jgi:CheY-specific phosphatase CheX